jgi:hypothetical protein
MAQNQTWIRPDSAKSSYSIDKQMQSGDFEAQSLNVVTYPAAASLPSTFTSSYYTPRNGDGTEKIIPSGIPFKIEGTWCWSFGDTEESTEGLVVTKAKRLLVQIATGLTTLAPGQRAYIIPTTGLVTNDANSATNNYIGTFWTAYADRVVFTTALTNGEYNGTLPAGSYAWIELEGSQAAPAS